MDTDTFTASLCLCANMLVLVCLQNEVNVAVKRDGIVRISDLGYVRHPVKYQIQYPAGLNNRYSDIRSDIRYSTHTYSKSVLQISAIFAVKHEF